MTLARFLTRALTPQRDLRQGQHFMNELYGADPKLYGLMVNTDLDVFYAPGVDSRVWRAVKFITDNWEGDR
jgi:hypothetical protein